MPPSSPEHAPRQAAAGGFLAFASGRLGAGTTLRPATRADEALIARIYASTRDEELRAVPWTAEQRKAFTDWQSQQQERHYALHYPAAERLVIERGEPVGRMYVDTTGAEVRLMEMTLLPPHRGRGLGSLLMHVLLEYAGEAALPVSLHVEPFNPARRMYERLGFRLVETRGLYEFMVREAGGAS